MLLVLLASNYAYLQGLGAPASLQEKSVDELIKALKTDYEPNLNW